jgi:hypothetical protein
MQLQSVERDFAELSRPNDLRDVVGGRFSMARQDEACVHPCRNWLAMTDPRHSARSMLNPKS